MRPVFQFIAWRDGRLNEKDEEFSAAARRRDDCGVGLVPHQRPGCERPAIAVEDVAG